MNRTNISEYIVFTDNNTNTDSQCENSTVNIYSSTFVECLRYYLKESILLTIINVLMILITLVANVVVIYLLFKRKCVKIVFDRILISHAFVDLLTNILSLPIYHFYLIFDYFPFGKVLCAYYLIVDHSTSTIEITHFIYMSYARLRCILAPKSYQKEYLINYSNIIILFIWSGIGLFWSAIAYFFNIRTYTEGECTIVYDDKYVGVVIVLIGYILPLIFTVGVTLFVFISIGRLQKTKQKYVEKVYTINKLSVPINKNSASGYIKRVLFNNPQVKLSLLTIVFNFCYLPYSIVLLLEATRAHDGSFTYIFTDLLCFSFSMLNPILILVLNFKFFFKKSR